MATNPKEFRVKNGLEITAGPIKINGSAGTSGQVISSTGTGVEWVQATAGSGSVTSITAGTGLSGGVITTSGTIAIDSTVVATLTGTQTLTNKTISGSANTLSNIANASLTNSTISGVALGSNLNTLTISSPLSGGSYNGSSAVSIGIPVATTSTNGYLSSTDWTTFNNKTSNTGTVTSVSGAGTVSGLTLTGTVTGSGSLTLGGTIATLNQNTTGSAGSISGFNNPTTAPTANTIVYRDSIGDIAAREIILSSGLSAVTPTVLVSMYPTTNQLVRTTPAAVAAALSGQTMNITGNATGSAGSVTGLTINNSSSAIDPNSVTQNQIGYANSLSLFGQTDGGLYSSAYNSSWIHEIFGDFRTGQIAIRGKNSGTFTAWRTVLDSTNYSSYAIPISGGISMSGGFGMNDQKLFLRGNGDTNHYLWNADDDWEELLAYSGTGFRVKSSSGASLMTFTTSAVNSGVALQQSGNQVLHAGNYTSYALPITGGTLTGQLRLFYGGSPELLFRHAAYPSIYGGRLQMLDYGDGMGINFDTSNNIDTWGTRMVVRHNGNVGIGTTTPSYKLDVSGTINGTEHYAGGWFRNSNSGQGLYNTATGNHFYSDGQYWNCAYSGTQGIRFRNGHAGGVLGYLYAETSAYFGLLNNSGNWAVMVIPSGGGVNLYGTEVNVAQTLYVHEADNKKRVPRTFVQSGTPSGTITDGDVWLQY